MRRRRKVVLGAVAVAAVAFFFLAPIVYWFSSSPPFNTQNPSPPRWTVYRSLGCVAVGVGDTYNQSPYYGGFRLSCQSPPVPNATATAR